MIDLELQGLRDEVLEVITPTAIQIGADVYAVYDTGIDEEPAKGIHVDVIAFDDPELAKHMDAAYIQGEGGHSTPIQHWSGTRIYVEKILKGSATWIGVTPEGQVVAHKFDAQSDDNGVIVYGAGWTGSWIAGPEGVEFVEICIPAFELDGSIVVLESQEAEPLLFSALYHTLMNMDYEGRQEEVRNAMEEQINTLLNDWKEDPKNRLKTKALQDMSELAYAMGYEHVFDILIDSEEFEHAMSAAIRDSMAARSYVHVFNRPLVAKPYAYAEKDDVDFCFSYSNHPVTGATMSIGRGKANLLTVVGIKEINTIGLRARK